MAGRDTVQVSVRLGANAVDFLDEQAEALGLSRAGAARYAVTLWMERETYRPRIEEALRQGMAETMRLHREGLIDLEEFTQDEKDLAGSESAEASPPQSGAEAGEGRTT